MRNKLVTTVFTTIVLSLGACTVKQGSAVKNPPKIDESRIESFKIEYGQFKTDLFSVLVWPNNWSERDWERNVNLVKIDSREIIKITVGINAKGIEERALYRAFKTQQCVQKYAKLDADESADDIPENRVLEWNDLAPVAAPTVPADGTPVDPQLQKAYDEYLAKSKELAFCKGNQDKRMADKAFVDAINSQSPSPVQVLQDKIGQELGQGKQLAADKGGTSIKMIMTDAGLKVSVRLRNFAGSGVDQSNEKDGGRIHDVIVENGGKHIRFTVPDVKNPDTEYLLDLYRSQDLIEAYEDEDGSGDLFTAAMAIYTGDVGVLEKGHLVGKGTAQLVGPLIKPAD